MKNRLLLPCVIIIAFLCASALPVHFMSYETTTEAVCQTTLTTEKETTSGQTEENKKEYIGITDSNTLISCIVMVDPDSFTSPQKADTDQLSQLPSGVCFTVPKKRATTSLLNR